MHHRLSRALCSVAFVAAAIVPASVDGAAFNTDNCNAYTISEKDVWNLIPIYYHDDDRADDIPNDIESIAAGFETGNAYYIGNKKLETLTNDIVGAQMCLQYQTDRPICVDLAASLYTYSRDVPGFEGSASQLVKQIAALSGQIADRSTDNSEYGKFHVKGFDGRDGHNSGHITQWSEDSATWHSWNCGIAFYPLDKGDELKYACNDENGRKTKWDVFYVKLKVNRHSIDNAPCSVTTTTTTATTSTTTVTTNTLEQAFNDLLNGGMQDTVAKHVQELMEAQIKKSDASITALQDEMKEMRAAFAAQIDMFAKQVPALQQQVDQLRDEKNGLVNTVDSLATGLISTLADRLDSVSAAADKAVMPPTDTPWQPSDGAPTVAAADGGDTLELASPKGKIILRSAECPELDLCATTKALNTFLQEIKALAQTTDGGGGR